MRCSNELSEYTLAATIFLNTIIQMHSMKGFLTLYIH